MNVDLSEEEAKAILTVAPGLSSNAAATVAFPPPIVEAMRGLAERVQAQWPRCPASIPDDNGAPLLRCDDPAGLGHQYHHRSKTRDGRFVWWEQDPS